MIKYFKNSKEIFKREDFKVHFYKMNSFQINNKDDKMDVIERQEITESAFHIPTDNFTLADDQLEFNTDAVANLDRQLTKSSEPFTTMGISSIKQLFFEVGLENVTEEQVKHFLNRLPRIEHLDFHQSAFEVLQFLSANPEFAKLIYSSKILLYVNYSTFETVDDEIKQSVSDVILKIIDAEPELVSTFLNQFFPYFYNNLESQNFYKNGRLDIHLQLAAKFICALSEDQSDQIETIFNKFTLEIHHRNPEVISASLSGIIISIRKHQFLLRNDQLSNPIFIDRLTFLGSQKNELTGPLVFIVLSYLLKSNISYPTEIYTLIIKLEIRYLDNKKENNKEDEYEEDQEDDDEQEPIDRRDAISLLTFAFANKSFVTSIEQNQELFESLMESFLAGYDQFKLAEKKDSACVIANFFGFLPLSIIRYYVSNDGLLLFDRLIDVLEFDDPNVLQPLLNGIGKSLNSANDLFTDEQKSALIYSIEPIKDSSNEKLARAAEIVLGILAPPE